MNLRKKEKIAPACVARIKDGFTKGKICIVKYFDHSSKPPMWYVTFDAGWCGWYKSKDLERIR